MIGLSRISIAIVALGMGMAAPLLAAGTPVRAENVRDDINNLDNDIDRADRNDTISEREAANLRTRVNDLRNDFQRMNANGLTQKEVNKLENRINNIRGTLRMEKVDYDFHAG